MDPTPLRLALPPREVGQFDIISSGTSASGSSPAASSLHGVACSPLPPKFSFLTPASPPVAFSRGGSGSGVGRACPSVCQSLGIIDVGWTVFSRVNELTGGLEFRALVVSLKTLSSYHSDWVESKTFAVQSALGEHRKAEERYDDAIHCCSTVYTDFPAKGHAEEQSLVHRFSQSQPVLQGWARAAPDVYQEVARDREPRVGEFSAVEKTRQMSSGFTGTFPAVPRLARTPIRRLSGGGGNVAGGATPIILWLSYLGQAENDYYAVPPTDFLPLLRDLAPSSSILGLLPGPHAPEGLLIFADEGMVSCAVMQRGPFDFCSLPSATTALRILKARQLELCDVLAKYQPWSSTYLPRLLMDLSPTLAVLTRCLFNLHEGGDGQAIGLGLVNVPADDPECIRALRRLTQLDTLTLGHRRGATETLRLLVTHPEATPLLGGSGGWRPSTADQSPSCVRRVSVWCALCHQQQRDVPAAWKHLTTDPHESRVRERNAALMNWLCDQTAFVTQALV